MLYSRDFFKLTSGNFLFLALALALCSFFRPVLAQTRLPTLAVLDFGNGPFGRIAANGLVTRLKSVPDINILDRDVIRIAVRGTGYSGSLNLALRQARDLGDAIGCDFYLLGDAQSLRRSTSDKPVYYEAYGSIFLVSSRTGKLVWWQRPSFEAAEAGVAEQKLLDRLSADVFYRQIVDAIQAAQKQEKLQRDSFSAAALPVIEEAPEDEKAADASGLRLPKPYRRLRPPYPDTAARADAEAVVDVVVDLDAAGEVTRADITRWAGFGLDEATIDTVRRLHFFPAMRDGTAIPIRVLLRYNFHKPAR
ncbi:MAG TPA: TonB family protein [Pyrinomonadaceae bacterium]|nr:TonB family protein [Pyrinomonadaceae bacterium]